VSDDDVEICVYGAVVKLDTKGVTFSAIGRTIVGMLVDALAADRVPARITGFCPALESQSSTRPTARRFHARGGRLGT
jgi:hypothetical protein